MVSHPARESMGSVLRAAGSIPGMVATALPLAGVFLWSVTGRGPSPMVLAAASSVRFFAALSLAAALLGIWFGLSSRRWPRLFFSCAIIAAIFWGRLSSSSYFSGNLSLGAGESGAPYADVVAGPSGKPPLQAIELQEISGAPKPGCRYRCGGREGFLALGEAVAADRVRLELKEVHPAPSFFIEEPDGSRPVQGYLKLGELGKWPEYFQFSILPHRFYLKPVSGVGGGEIPPGKLDIRVTRSKLTLVKRDVLAGEKVPVDGFFVGFDPGSGWALLRVTTLPPNWPLALASALLLAAVAAGLMGRGRS